MRKRSWQPRGSVENLDPSDLCVLEDDRKELKLAGILSGGERAATLLPNMMLLLFLGGL